MWEFFRSLFSLWIFDSRFGAQPPQAEARATEGLVTKRRADAHAQFFFRLGIG